ncbi:hypothetical protein N8I77_005569 [Diaporthe amygdali]|uniref:NACHT domain-containing protein n=1 Tax=Phomopsis amygdali TaxID=1214568 RepID=A0AAD9SFB1_PHOAM|nr:hypothetical protein N8I77_005569 [Diaporthe amygdali]
MDPLSAFGLAASTVQFVTFATTLVHKSIEIYDRGATSETTNIEDTYETLSKFSKSLGFYSKWNNIDPGILDQAQGLKSLAEICHDDCDKLLIVVSKLKTTTGPKRKLLKTFKAAWATFIKDDEIACLERRLARSQTTLTLCICQISNHYLETHGDELDSLKKQATKHHVHQDEKLMKIQNTLDEIMLIVQAKNSIHAAPFSDPDVEALRKQMSSLEIMKTNIAREHRFLDSLHFKRQPERHCSIPKAHRQTLSWILDPSGTDAEASKLLQWLGQPEGGIFWVSGKAGSGKSTLMKFVADNKDTKRILSIWSKERKLVVASHYFWWSGTSLQKSQEGLLRTLLYSILQQCPDLIQLIYEEGLAGDPNLISSGDSDDSDQRSWTLEELHSIIRIIANHPSVPVRFCFFVDGLDEYDGDHKEICDIFNELVSSSSGIKICLSSRPWNTFEQAFGIERRRIYIHDLTREDMRKFTQSRLSEHSQWQFISQRTPGVQGLVNEVTDRAQGVFLWVFLVTGLLREGLSNGDSLSDLKLRLKTFPSDLERFFKDILEKVDTFYHTKVSAVLQTALSAKEPLNVSLYAFLEEEFENADYALAKPVGAISDELVEERHRVMAQRLNGWSKGLVEVRKQEVHFLHRTVVDFLRTREMVDFMASKLPSGFCVSLSLLKAHLAWMKTSHFSEPFLASHSANPTKMELRVEDALRWAFEIEATVPSSSPIHDTAGPLLDDMECSIETLQASASVNFVDQKEAQLARHFFRESVLHARLASYLSRKLLVMPDYFDFLPKPAISVLLDGPVRNTWKSSWPKGWIDTLRSLLENGQSLDQEYTENEDISHIRTPWKQLLSMVIVWDDLKKSVTAGDLFASTMQNALCALCLEHGGDPNALIFRTGMAFPSFSTAWVDMLLMSFEISSKLSDEEAYLQQLNAFIRHGAKIDASYKSTVISNELVSHGAPAYEAFFSQLDQRAKSGQCNASLLARVTKILLKKMQDSGIQLDWAFGKISTTLAPVIVQRLRSECEARANRRAAKGKRKKERREDRSSRKSSKRQKLSA